MEFKLNKNFYKEDSILKAISDFKDVSNITIINKDNDYFIIKTDKNIENLKEEFCNYVIGIMKNEGFLDE
jgi:hypothetical protein